MPIDWNEIKTWVKDTTKIAMKEAEDLTVKGKLKMEIFSLTREKERRLTNLGNLIYTEYQSKNALNLTDDVKTLIDKITRLDDKINTKKAELKKQR